MRIDLGDAATVPDRRVPVDGRPGQRGGADSGRVLEETSPCASGGFLPRFAFHLSDRYDPPTVWRQADVYESLEWNDQYTELWTQMKQGGFYDSLKEMAAQQEEAARARD